MDFDKALQVQQEYLDNTNDMSRYSLFVSRLYCKKRMFDQASQMVDQWCSFMKNQERKKWMSAFCKSINEFFRGDLDLSRQLFDEYLSRSLEMNQNVDSAILMNTFIPLIKGQLKRVFPMYDKYYTQIIKAQEEQNTYEESDLIFYYILKGSLYLRIKKFDQALDSFQKASECIPPEGVWVKRDRMQKKRRNLLWLGLTHAERGDIKKVEEVADEIRRLTPDNLVNQYPNSYYNTELHFIDGVLALKKGDFSKAIKNLEKAQNINVAENFTGEDRVDALLLNYLAKAYQQKGDLDQAIKTYVRITLLFGGRSHFGDLYTKSYYQMGKLFEQMGNKEKARENYNTFIELFKDSDPQFQHLVENARERIKELAPSPQPPAPSKL
jgi:tetratricopeptide (TPR) repeat protein